MADALPRLFRHSWGFTAVTLGGLASMLALTAAVFRHIVRDAAQATGQCAPPVPEGFEVYCMLGTALWKIAGGLNLLAIVVAGAAFWAVYRWSRQRDGGD